MEFHPRAHDASLEKLRALSGIIRVKGPVPSHKFLLAGDEQEEPKQRARD